MFGSSVEVSQHSTQMKELDEKQLSLMSPTGEKSIDGTGNLTAMREIKVELNARKPVFEVRGKSSLLEG